MSSKSSIFIIISIIVPLWLVAPDAGATARHPYAAGELLVKLKPASQGVSMVALRQAAGVSRTRNLGHSRIQRVILAPGASMDHALAMYASDPNVEFVEPNYLLRTQSRPDDTHFARQWGLFNSGQMVSGYVGTPGVDMDMQDAWDITKGDPQVVVAVIDTGCDLKHPDLTASIWTNAGEIPDNGVDDDGNGYIDDVHGWDFADGDNSPQDSTGHGTHVAGIIAAGGDNNQGVAGVAWQARIMPLRFMDAFEQGTTADAIQAIYYAIDQGARIINCSWGTTSPSASLQNVIANTDALFICAAGNSGVNADDNAFYPASFPSDNIISAAAGDQMGLLAWFSNFGTASVDVVAPGIRIYSLDNGRGILWSEKFDDGLPDDWATGGEGDRWAVAVVPYSQEAMSLASSPDEDYTDNANNWARSPALDLSTASASKLTFHLIGSSQANADYLHLDISTDGNTWHNRPLLVGSAIHHTGLSGAMPYWVSANADLGPWDGQPQIYIRFRFLSDAAGTAPGFYIDNITLNAGMVMDQYQFMQGTSMAAGFVSGLAALIQSAEPNLLPLEVKAVILSSVDLDLDLYDFTLSGGSANAYNALTLLREVSLFASYSTADSIQLQWTAQGILNSDVTIQRRAEGEMEFSTIGRVNASASNYEDHAVTPDTPYYYRVEAVTEDGRCGYSNQSLANATNRGGTAIEDGGGSSGGGGCFIQGLMHP